MLVFPLNGVTSPFKWGGGNRWIVEPGETWGGEETEETQCEELMALGVSQRMFHRLSPRPGACVGIVCSLGGEGAGGDEFSGSYIPMTHLTHHRAQLSQS